MRSPTKTLLKISLKADFLNSITGRYHEASGKV